MGLNKKNLSAENKLLALLAQRDHSEKELRTKLKKYPVEDVNLAINKAKERNWLKPAEDLSYKVAAMLSQKGKGQLYIQNYLRQKGLPNIRMDEEEEFNKACRLIESLRHKQKDFIKWSRYLQNRGYETSIIRKVLNAHSHNTKSTDDDEQ
jgi:regulatory protein